jgi:hypothetical protein
MSDGSPERSPWWRVVEEHLEQWEEARHDDLADPWADIDEPAAGLTDAQRALLVGDDDQPGPPRLAGTPTDDDHPTVPRLSASEPVADPQDDDATDEP